MILASVAPFSRANLTRKWNFSAFSEDIVSQTFWA
jgi:hypothetical protein